MTAEVLHGVGEEGVASGQGALFRKLKPGPGLPAEQVLANQRSRLCRAMVELVADCGYRRVTVRDVSRLAGVSTKTFYKCFNNVEECFAATYGGIAASALKSAAAAYPSEDRERVRRGVHAAFGRLRGDPKAARLVLFESLAAGSAVTERARSYGRILRRLVRDEFAAGPNSVPVPDVVAQGIVGAALHVARSRLLDTSTAEVLTISDAFTDWLLALRDERLARVSLAPLNGHSIVPASPASRSFGDDRQFLLSAVSRLSLSQGYAGLTAAAIRREAGVSRRRFEEHFEGVSDCFLAAVEAMFDRASDRIEVEMNSADSWEQGIVDAAALICGILARDSELGRLGFLDILAPGLPGLELRKATIGRWARLLGEESATEGLYGELATEASVAAMWSMARAEIATGKAARIAALAPIVAFVVLAPNVGACAAARAIGADPPLPPMDRKVRRHSTQCP